MKLCFSLPPEQAAALAPYLKGETPVYCVPYDLTPQHALCDNGYVAVTHRALYLITGSEVQEYPLAADMSFVCEAEVDCGFLILKEKERETLLCRFSMKQITRMSYLAQGATLFAAGEDRTVESREREKYCFKCGKPLHGGNRCVFCEGGGGTLHRLVELCSHYFLPLILLTASTAVMALLRVGSQFVSRDFIDTILLPVQGSVPDILRFTGLMLLFSLLILLFQTGQTLGSAYLGTRISNDLRHRVFEHLNLLSFSYISQYEAGTLMNRVTQDTQVISDFMMETFGQMFSQVLTMLFAAAIMLQMSPLLTLAAFAFVPVVLLARRLFRTKERRMYRQQWRFTDRVNSRLQDVISGIRVVKSFGQEKREIDRFSGYQKRLTFLQRRNELFFATFYPIVSMLFSAGTVLVMYLGGVRVMDGSFTPGQLVQFMAYAGMLYGPIDFFVRLPRMLMQLNTSITRIYEVLEEDLTMQDEDDSVEGDLSGDIVLRNITFGYHSYAPVLEDIDLHIKAGEMIGLVGASGTGKSTTINLLMRLYDPDKGEITAGGVPIRKMKQKSLHSKIGVVLQETFLFSGSLYDNIAYAKANATPAEVIRAAKLANAHGFITRLPDGYDTYVGERGYRLSGGERQRIAIARAILNDPELLILDEATSSLDTETEFQIQQALSRLVKGRTTVAIAHRLSTLRDADRLIVLDRHRIAEMGSHEELIVKQGLYYRLVVAQLDMFSMDAKPQ